jgi:hypothetical protein
MPLRRQPVNKHASEPARCNAAGRGVESSVLGAIQFTPWIGRHATVEPLGVAPASIPRKTRRSFFPL